MVCCSQEPVVECFSLNGDGPVPLCGYASETGACKLTLCHSRVCLEDSDGCPHVNGKRCLATAQELTQLNRGGVE